MCSSHCLLFLFLLSLPILLLTTDPNVVENAKFAVSQHNKEAKTNLVFESVVEGRYQLNSGTLYELVLKASSPASPSANYVTSVWDHGFNVRDLIDFYKKMMNEIG
ncbi:hypothetical protein ACLB2K_061021 [Fragaria x ananassa]